MEDPVRVEGLLPLTSFTNNSIIFVAGAVPDGSSEVLTTLAALFVVSGIERRRRLRGGGLHLVMRRHVLRCWTMSDQIMNN